MEKSRRPLWLYALPSLLVTGYFGLSAAYALIEYDAYASSTPHLVRYLIAPALISACFFSCGALLSRESNLLVGLLGLAVLGAFFSMESIASFRTIPVILGNLGYVDPEQDEMGTEALGVIPPKGVNRVLKIQKLADAHLSASIPNTTTLLCAKNGAPIYYFSDRFGFNNQNKAYAERMDMVVLGDSVIEGICLQPGGDVVSQIRKSFPHSVGLAVRSNGPLMELATLGRYGPVLRPRHVVFTFFEANDWRNMDAELRDSWLRDALSPDADFGSVSTQHMLIEKARPLMPKKRHVDVFDVFLKTSFIRNFFALRQTTRILGLHYPAYPKKIPEFETVLKRAKEITESWGGQLHLLYIPRQGRQVGLFPNKFAFDALAAEVLSAAHAVGVPTINMTEFFDEQPDAEVFYSFGHLSEEGAEFVAEVISSWIEEFHEG